jgi:hypothetical protein
VRRSIAVILPLAGLFLASAALAGGQGSGGDDGTPPAMLNPGDENSPGAYAGPVFMELRDIPNVGAGAPSRFGARFMRVTARIGDGDTFRLLDADFVCGDASVADPCTPETICRIGKGNKEVCELGLVVDVRKSAEIQAVVISLLAPRIVSGFGLDPGTVLELAKLKKYVQAGPIGDADGVLSFGAIADIAFDIP